MSDDAGERRLTDRRESARRIAADPTNFRPGHPPYYTEADWFDVRSESNPRRWYHVVSSERNFSCACRDFRDRFLPNHKCKHILAVELHVHKEFLRDPDPLCAEYLNNEMGQETVLQLFEHEQDGRRGWLLEHEPDYGGIPLANWVKVEEIRRWASLVIDHAKPVGSLIFVNAPRKTRDSIAVTTLQKLGFVRLDDTVLLYDPASAPDPYIGVSAEVRDFVQRTEEDFEQLVGYMRGGTDRYEAERMLREFRQRKLDFLEALVNRR